MIENKIDQFCKGTLKKINYIDKNSADTLEIKEKKYLKGCIFEKCINFQSPIIKANAKVFLGAYSYMNSGGYVRENVFIGRFCSIGRRVTISAGRHNIHGLSTSPLLNHEVDKYSREEETYLGVKNQKKMVIIENDVWIGDGAIIMPGITISTGSIIASNCVVTKDVPPYAIVGGVPGRLIKYRFKKEITEKLILSRWWNVDLETLRSLPKKNIFKFIKKTSSMELNFEDYTNYMLNHDQ